MKQEWQETTLNDICININDGDWIERKDQSKEGIRLIQTGNVGNGIFLDKNNRARFISKKTFKRLNCTEIFQNDCLVSRLPDPIGRACLVPKLKQQMITAVDCAILKFNLKKIDPKFFIYYSISSKYTSQVNECITGSTRQRISKSKLSAINISIPNLLSEQKRIVKILDKAFEDIEKIKENAKQNLQNSKSLFQSYLNKLFTENTKDWKEKKIEEVCDIISGTTPDTHNKLYWNGRNFWITPAEINEKFVYINNTERKITDLAVKECSLRKMPKGTIIFSSRAPIGKIAISNIDLYCNQGFKNFICSQDILNTFLYYFLLCKKQYIISLGKGTTFKEVSKKIVANIQINFPNISIQKQIVKKLDMLQEKTKKLEEIYNKKLQLTEELKQSILHKAFNGDL